jgi:hypothetical protein
MKKYNILDKNEIEIIDEVITQTKRVIPLSTIEKRINDINNSISELEKEKTEWQNLVSDIKNKKKDIKLPDNI